MLDTRYAGVCLEGGDCVFTIDAEAGDGRVNCERCGMTAVQARKAKREQEIEARMRSDAFKKFGRKVRYGR